MKKLIIALLLVSSLSSCGSVGRQVLADMLLPEFINYSDRGLDPLEGTTVSLYPSLVPTKKSKQKLRNKLIKQGKCPDCAGKGVIKNSVCEACNGSGKFY